MGDIAAIDGPVALFTPRALDSDTLARIRATGMGLRSHFPRNPSNVPLGLAWSYLRHCASVAVGTPEVLGSALVARSLAALLLEMLAGSDSPDAIHRQPAEDYLRLREAIEGGFAAERRVAAYARRLGYSTRTLDRLARANAGLTAKALIDERVVLEAQRMLVHGEEPVAAIAAAVGFDDPSNFSKYFAHRAGSTPAAFRRGARGGNQMPLPDRRSPSKPTRRRRR